MARVRAHEVATLIEDRIGGPREILLEGEVQNGRPTGYLIEVIEDEASYRAYAGRRLADQGKPGGLDERLETPPAYVSAGRWVIDCDCGSGAAASPEWGVAICCQCGSAYHPVFPADWREAENLLLQRPRVGQRHYFPDKKTAKQRRLEQAETVRDLREQNQRRGIGKG